MARDTTASFDTQTQQAHQRVLVLVELLFPSDPVRVWQGVGDLAWNGKTWKGIGDLGAVERVGESVGFEAQALKMQLSGVPGENIALARGQDYQGQPATIWFGYLNADSSVVPDPTIIFDGTMDQMVIVDEGDMSTITVTIESELSDADRAIDILFDNEQQKKRYPNDEGFKWVTGLQEKQVPWGEGGSRGNAPRIVRRPEGGPGGGGR